MTDTDEIKLAYDHIIQELLLDKIKPSLGIDFKKAQQAHDSTHQLMLLGANIAENLDNYSFKTNSVYFIYNWELFDQITRSNIEALSTFYNSAFVLLRTVVELLIKGVFYDCLSHKKFREDAKIIEQANTEINLKSFLSARIQKDPNIIDEFEKISMSIFDELDLYLSQRKNVLSTKLMLRQIIDWRMLEGVEDAKNLIYGIYERLSSDVHVSHNNIDIGRRLNTDRELFKKREIMPEYLTEYLELLHTITDICLVVMLNLFREDIQKSNNTKEMLKKKLNEQHFLSLELSRTTNRIKDLVESK